MALYEIGGPLFFCFLLLVLRSKFQMTEQELKIYEPFKPNPGTLCSSYGNKTQISVAYSPTSPLLENTVKNVCPNVGVIKSYKTAKELNAAIEEKKFSFALQMDDKLLGVDKINDLPGNIEIYLRLPSEDHKTSQKDEWFTNLLYPVVQVGPRSFGEANGGEPGYGKRGFLYLQQTVTFSFINLAENSTQNLDILLNRFPNPAWKENAVNLKLIQVVSALFIVMAFMINVNNIVTQVATEKETQLKEYMKIMGLSAWIHWLSWLFWSLFVLTLVIIILVIALKVKIMSRAVFVYTDVTVLFTLLVLYGCSLITFCFLVCSIFQKAIIATIVAVIVMLAACMAPNLLLEKNDIIPQSTKIAMSLLSPSAAFFGLIIMFQFEAKEEGSHWSNLFQSTIPDDLTVGAVFLILIFDTILYMLFALYFEAIIPGEFSIAKPWNFPFTRSFWCGTPPQEQSAQESTQAKGEQFEEFTEKLPIGIRIKNLSKTFGQHTAVKNLNLDMYEGHITVLLGHNGAGKTTAMSMICGIIPPTNGTVMVNGYDVRTNIQNVRESMGMCLQHNILFDNLSVEEHLCFFCKLKGTKSEQITKEVDDYLKILEIENKRRACSKTLSGGMKRKLSVAIALCGKSKVVILDEPTAGMDPSARRTVWALLQKQKSGRTILLTTHYMDEADVLGDRIAIMSFGELQCCGSSFFLKKKFGSGYSLIVEVTPKCQPRYVTDLLRKYIPYMEIHAQMGSELTYILPDRESQKFEALLYDLEHQKASLGVENFGISLASLEEIFLKVGADQNSEMFNTNQSKKEITHVSGFGLLRNQIVAMILKKELSIFRSWILFLFQILLPILVLVCYIFLFGSNPNETSYSSRKIALSSYKNPITLLENTNSMAETYVKVLKGHQVKTVDNITAKILNLEPSTVKESYIVAASFNDTTATAWFNGDPYHATPLSLSLVLNTLYKTSLGEDKSITFYNHPLPLSDDAKITATENKPSSSSVEMGLIFGLGIVVSTYILFYIRERVCKCKHLQMISGVNVFVFWSTAFLCDVIFYLMTIIFLLIILIESPLSSLQASEIGIVLLLFVCFCFFVLPFIYLMSYCFKLPAIGCVTMVSIGLLMGFLPPMITNFLKLFGASKSTMSFMHWVFAFIPYTALSHGISDVVHIRHLRNLCLKNNVNAEKACSLNKICCDLDYYSLEAPGIGLLVIISFTMSFVIFTVIFLIEFGVLGCLVGKIIHFGKRPNRAVILENDVQSENEKIRRKSEEDLKSEYSVVLRDLTKYYGVRFLAVNDLCLGLKPYECFGLLGVNGAGKTTTFQMLTGDARITYGNAWVEGLSVKTQQKQVQKFIGYCPQFDAVLDDLTVKETLLVFGLIRGVPFNESIPLAETLAHDLDFFKHIDKKVKQLSGGNKRKLSTALALIGDPPVIFLDEPSAGMDPATKRNLWNGLAKLRESGKCIVLTSHSMEECEALCTKIAIMVNGTFQCLGSTQRLKSKFAQGFTLSIKIKKYDDKTPIDDQIKTIDHFIQRYFPGSELKERYQELVTYKLVSDRMSLSQMFGLIEGSKRQLSIEDYSLGQCSLEQVFLSFAKNQKE
ncbi:phospholipid-transporting ATPase ABCA1-like [Tribolium madens]|uniref:phospholipid-transporting ATPase ABCA1-like n=1 Tax=Tribolium madens TaxID=41895 RepID=UPI001CF720DE|nr:phospholipid-transporting ATPase ABCA1-like [Tribolium madens]